MHVYCRYCIITFYQFYNYSYLINSLNFIIILSVIFKCKQNENYKNNKYYKLNVLII